MAVNFLQNFRNPMQAPSMPFNPAPTPPTMPIMQGDLQKMTQGAPRESSALEMMRDIGGDSIASNAPQQAQPAPQSQDAPRKRRSFLETIGGLADVIATVGGAQPLYQPTLDALEDRARQVDLEALRKQQIEQQMQLGGQQLQIGEQTLEANEDEMASSSRARLATALGAIASDPSAASLWPQIAAEAGLDEQQAAQVGQIIQDNPNAAGILARSLGWSPEVRAQGSQAKELQVYGLLQQQDPELAQEYLRSIARPDTMSEAEMVNLRIRMAELGMRREDRAFDRDFREREFELKERQAETKGAGDAPEAADSNSVANILTDFGVVLDGPNDPIAEMIKNSTNGYIQYGLSMIPSAFGESTPGMEQIAKLQTIDNALILALAGGKLGAGVSNADRSFFEKMAGRISDPTIPADQRLAAWNQIKTRFRGVIQREAKPRAPAARPRASERVMPRTGRGQRPSANGNIVTVSNAGEARNLPSGTRFRTPDGRVMVKR